MRVAFTIVLNGLHHLKHKDFCDFMVKNFDYWAIAEGASGNTGSTAWCNSMPADYHNNGRSVDGTCEFLAELASQHPNVLLTNHEGLWNNKDHQVNTAVDLLRAKTEFPAYLWEVDVDEHWTVEKLEKAERILTKNNYKHLRFWVNQFVGEGLISQGSWGEQGPWWYRLWNWNGERFAKHEPPELEGGNGPGQLVSDIRFDHYSYYFEKDVAFKDKWYGGHQGVLERWKALKDETVFPQPLRRLIPFAGENDKIVRI